MLFYVLNESFGDYFFVFVEKWFNFGCLVQNLSASTFIHRIHKCFNLLKTLNRKVIDLKRVFNHSLGCRQRSWHVLVDQLVCFAAMKRSSSLNWEIIILLQQRFQFDFQHIVIWILSWKFLFLLWEIISGT